MIGFEYCVAILIRNKLFYKILGILIGSCTSFLASRTITSSIKVRQGQPGFRRSREQRFVIELGQEEAAEPP